MNKQFIPTSHNEYQLKKQGIISTIIIGGGLLSLALLLLKKFLETNSEDKSLLYFGLVILLFSIIIFLKQTRKFIIYPAEKRISYSSSFISPKKNFAFNEFNGIVVERAKNYLGFIVGNSLKLSFIQNGKEKEILLGQNVSAKKMRMISEEIEAIINPL